MASSAAGEGTGENMAEVGGRTVLLLGDCAGAPAGERANPHLSIEGAETPQAAGKVIAFLISKTTPKLPLFLKASQIH